MVSTQELNRRLSLVLDCPSVEEMCLKFIVEWGMEAQILTAVEEMSELTKELTRWIARGVKTDTYDKLVDEMVDVMNTWHQVFYLMDQLWDRNVEEDINSRCVFKFMRAYGKLPEDRQ